MVPLEMSLKRMLDTSNSDYTTTQFLEEVCSSKYINFDEEKSPEKDSINNWSPPRKRIKKEKSEELSPKPKTIELETNSPGVKSLSNLDWLIDVKMTDLIPNLVNIDNVCEEQNNCNKKPEKKSTNSQNSKMSKQDSLMKRIKELLPLKAVENNNYKQRNDETETPSVLWYVIYNIVHLNIL